MSKRKQDKQLDFRVIAGTLKGTRIVTPDLGVTRPPLTRLRRAIFDFLGPYLDEADYLDLFSGTGSYLFEAVSRGASHATGVEKEPLLAEAINDQAKENGVEGQLRCLCGDVYDVIRRLASERKAFHAIMMAPPQYQGMIGQTLALLKEHPLSTDDGMIICQHDTSETKDIDFTNFPMLQQRKYGNTTFTVLGTK